MGRIRLASQYRLVFWHNLSGAYTLTSIRDVFNPIQMKFERQQLLTIPCHTLFLLLVNCADNFPSRNKLLLSIKLLPFRAFLQRGKPMQMLLFTVHISLEWLVNCSNIGSFAADSYTSEHPVINDYSAIVLPSLTFRIGLATLVIATVVQLGRDDYELEMLPVDSAPFVNPSFKLC